MIVPYPVVMLWRQVGDLHTANSNNQRILGLNLIGQDEYSLIFDSGALLGLWVKDDAAMRANEACSALNYTQVVPRISNPASELILVTPQLARARRAASLVGGINVLPLDGRGGRESLQFEDPSGNATFVVESNRSWLETPEGQAINTVLSRRSNNPLRRPVFGNLLRWVRSNNPLRRVRDEEDSKATLAAYRITVTSLNRSRQFYTQTLGFPVIAAEAASLQLDGGELAISLKEEEFPGMVEGLRRAGQLASDWLVLLTKNIDDAVEQLGDKGVVFPEGTESSGIGRVAYFEDPDGHSLSLWEPSGAPTELHPINFYPSLKRIYREVA